MVRGDPLRATTAKVLVEAWYSSTSPLGRSTLSVPAGGREVKVADVLDIAAKKLMAAGLNNVFSYAGGYEDWRSRQAGGGAG